MAMHPQQARPPLHSSALHALAHGDTLNQCLSLRSKLELSTELQGGRRHGHHGQGKGGCRVHAVSVDHTVSDRGTPRNICNVCVCGCARSAALDWVVVRRTQRDTAHAWTALHGLAVDKSKQCTVTTVLKLAHSVCVDSPSQTAWMVALHVDVVMCLLQRSHRHREKVAPSVCVGSSAQAAWMVALHVVASWSMLC